VSIETNEEIEMSEPKYVVIVVEDSTGKVIHTICGGKGVTKNKAERIMNGASINLDHYKYSLRMIPCV
jgi:hypothetical protein